MGTAGRLWVGGVPEREVGDLAQVFAVQHVVAVERRRHARGHRLGKVAGGTLPQAHTHARALAAEAVPTACSGARAVVIVGPPAVHRPHVRRIGAHKAVSVQIFALGQRRGVRVELCCGHEAGLVHEIQRSLAHRRAAQRSGPRGTRVGACFDHGHGNGAHPAPDAAEGTGTRMLLVRACTGHDRHTSPRPGQGGGGGGGGGIGGGGAENGDIRGSGGWDAGEVGAR
mmetsp:Transcript_12390/g.30053  ORF Transcript_12390/g.30053 Transcript_12390/m.30053 type:complete len:227 (-) Transcript_12390:170-850(-)